MIISGIETSCDETSVSIVKDGKILSMEVSSSVHLHSKYGGVIPEIASRYHTEYIYPVFNEAIRKAGITPYDIDLVAVTNKPGLPGSLLVGTAFAKAVSYALGIPLIGIDHVQAHLIGAFIDNDLNMRKDHGFPFLGLAVSGGHTSIYICREYDFFEIIGRTKDDAVGEAFDKVAKIINLGYPGGPVIEKMASLYSGKDDIGFPKALLGPDKTFDFSFSGIKTAVLHYWQKSDKTEDDMIKICYSFQEAVTDTLVEKMRRTIERTGIKNIAIGGGVINNSILRNKMSKLAGDTGAQLYLPIKGYCMDNAGMIAVYGELLFKMGYSSDLELKTAP